MVEVYSWHWSVARSMEVAGPWNRQIMAAATRQCDYCVLGKGRERERVCVCVCVCVWERERQIAVGLRTLVQSEIAHRLSHAGVQRWPTTGDDYADRRARHRPPNGVADDGFAGDQVASIGSMDARTNARTRARTVPAPAPPTPTPPPRPANQRPVHFFFASSTGFGRAQPSEPEAAIALFFSFLHRVSSKKNKFRRGFSSASFDRLEPGCDWWVFLWQGSVVLFSTMEMSATATPDWLRPRRECVCGCGRRSETTGRHRHSNEHWMRCERRRPLATDLITTDPSRLNESTWASWASSSTPFDHYPVSLVFLRFCYRCRCVFHCAALSCPRFYRGLPGITGFWNDSTVLQLFSSSNYVPLGLLGLVLLHPSCLLSCTRLLMGCWWIHCMLPSLSSMLLGFWMDGPLSLSIISMTFN